MPIIRLRNSILTALCGMLLMAACCRDNVCDTPFGEGGVIDINRPDFAALQTVGGTVTINRGYKGIFVRRISYAEFVAFECACPHCHETRLVEDPDWNGAILRCPDCHSQFETEYGNPRRLRHRLHALRVSHSFRRLHPRNLLAVFYLT